MMEDILKNMDKKKEEILGLVDEKIVDSIKTNGISMRIGNKIIKMDLVQEEISSIEDEIREEFREKLVSKMKFIRDEVNKRSIETSQLISTFKLSYEKKKADYDRKIASIISMPEVNIEHAIQGLSVVRGQHGDGSYTWFVQGIYWPKTVDFKNINPKMSKKMLTNIIFRIDTEGYRVVKVSTHKIIGLEYFQHYHQHNPDCWGKWTYPNTWSTPSDIIAIARKAEAVLENINIKSIAMENPRGLPRKSTLIKHLVDKKINQKLSMDSSRVGITENVRQNDMNVWGS